MVVSCVVIQADHLQHGHENERLSHTISDLSLCEKIGLHNLIRGKTKTSILELLCYQYKKNRLLNTVYGFPKEIMAVCISGFCHVRLLLRYA